MKRLALILAILAGFSSLLIAAPLQYLTKYTVSETAFENPGTNWNAGDDASIQISIGFDFPFNGTTYNQVWINSNGMLSFNASNTAYKNSALPYTSAAQSIYPYWDDMNRPQGGTIRYGTLGNVSNRHLVISWNSVRHYDNFGNYTFEVVLYEDGGIRFRYDATSNADGTNCQGQPGCTEWGNPKAGATIGVQEDTSHFDQHSYNAAINQTQDILYTPTTISGHIYEDPDGDSQMGDEIAKSNVTVNLYRNSDTSSVYKTTTTDANGYYHFDNLYVDEVYWVAVDSKTFSPDQSFTSGNNQGDIWAEQTYGTAGAQCADGGGGTSTRSSAGSCYGGKDGAVSDDASAYSTSEHLIRIDTNGLNDNPDNDFGFSFNVVTSIRDGDDDTGNDRSIQGSLRQFIQDANALDGANAMRFVPAVAQNESSWWKVTLGSALPQLSNTETTINGTAYSLSDGTTVDNSNSGTLAMSGHTVGAGTDAIENSGDEEHLPTFDHKEFEIDGGGTSIVFDCTQGEMTIEDLAVFHATTALNMSNSSDNNRMQRLYLGARADGSDPGGSSRLTQATKSTSGSIEDKIYDNYIAYATSTTVYFSGTGEIKGNYIYHTATGGTNNDALTLEGNMATRAVTIHQNYIDGANAYGIESWRAGGGFTIEHNTVINTGTGGGVENGAIRIFGRGSTLRYNVITNAAGAGIVLVNRGGVETDQNIIKHNVIYGNGGLSIDLDQTHTTGNPNGDGVSPNNGSLDSGKQNDDMDYPVITKATYDGSTLHIEGYVGSAAGQSDFGHADLEIYKADDDANNDGEVIAGDGNSTAHGEGKEFFFDGCSTDGSGNFSCDHTVSGLASGTMLTLTATLNSHGTSEFSANYSFVLLPDMHITKTSCVINDPVNSGTNPKRIPGATIRYAIEVSNTGVGVAQNAIADDNVSTHFDETTIANLKIDGSHACDCLSPTSPGTNGSNGGVSGRNVKLDFDDVAAGATECGYFEVKIQ